MMTSRTYHSLHLDIATYDSSSIIYLLVPQRLPEGELAGIFSVWAGVSLTIPISNGRLNMGTWQGIYLCEFRNHGGSRRIVATIYE